MKQTLADLMRMSRICRMVFATCLGSFILVIFYFQSMFQPGRTCLLSVSSGQHRYAPRRCGVLMERARVDASLGLVTRLLIYGETAGFASGAAGLSCCAHLGRFSPVGHVFCAFWRM